MELEDQVSAQSTSTYVPPQPTGRQIIKFQHGLSSQDALALLRESVGRDIVTSREQTGSYHSANKLAAAWGGAVLFEKSGVAIVDGDRSRAMSIATRLSARDEVAEVRPEFWMFALDTGPWPDTAAETWGLDAVGAIRSAYDGTGIKIAVLDTGIDLAHSDFAGRRIVTESFVSGQTVADVQGHGTHCAGTAAGRGRQSGNVPRYGVAPGAELYVGKVLGDNGSGREGDIIAGIEWAVSQGCEIISMSLGRPTTPDEPFDPIYEDEGANALSEGSLIIAAAGNESARRYNYIAPVGAPANAPSIMAVAAIGSDAGVASFSCGGVGTGQIDIAGPGVAVFSSVPTPRLYAKLNGTSMACPHVAGVAALWAQSDPALRGQALWDRLVASAQDVALDARDAGAGLASCP